MDYATSWLSIICMALAVICMLKGLYMLISEWRHEKQMKDSLRAVHTAFLLESLKRNK